MAGRLLFRALSFLAFSLLIFTQVSARSVSFNPERSLSDFSSWLHHSQSSNISVHRRDEDEEKPTLTWDKAVQNGDGHMCNFARRDTPVHPKTGQPKPIWSQPDLDLYWTEQIGPVGNEGVTPTTEALGDALKELKLSANFPPNRLFNWIQDREWKGADGEIFTVSFPFSDLYHVDDL